MTNKKKYVYYIVKDEVPACPRTIDLGYFGTHCHVCDLPVCTTNTKKSEYSVEDAMYAPAPAGGKATKCGMKAGTGLASSLLPREVASKADFGEFKPDDVLKGQKNFLRTAIPSWIPGKCGRCSSKMRTNKSEPICRWQRRLTCGKTVPFPPIPCSVTCKYSIKDIRLD